jgi:O-methyltransferase involved in polyketide biosynthesis
MEENQASLTARITAYFRAHHAMHDTPKIFDDFLARAMFSDADFAQMKKTWRRH